MWIVSMIANWLFAELTKCWIFKDNYTGMWNLDLVCEILTN